MTMLTFHNYIDYQQRMYCKPTVAKLLCTKTAQVKYVVIGTNYGHIRASNGTPKTFDSYSGARRAARNYVGF